MPFPLIYSLQNKNLGMQTGWSGSHNETVEKHVTESAFQDPLLIL